MKQNSAPLSQHESSFDILLGCAAAFSYAFVSALARVFIESIGNQLNPLLALLFSLVITTLFFHLINLNKLGFIYRKALLQKRTWIYVMLITSVLWDL